MDDGELISIWMVVGRQMVDGCVFGWVDDSGICQEMITGMAGTDP